MSITSVESSPTPERWFFGRQRHPQRKRAKVKAYPYRGNVQRLTLPAALSRGAAPKVAVLERESDEVAGCGPMSRRYGASTVRASLAPTSGRLGSANCFAVGCTRALSVPARSAAGWGRGASFPPAPRAATRSPAAKASVDGIRMSNFMMYSVGFVAALKWSIPPGSRRSLRAIKCIPWRNDHGSD